MKNTRIWKQTPSKKSIGETNLRVVPVRKQGDEAMSVGSGSSSLDFCHSCIGLSVENVIEYCCGKERRFLVHQTNLSPQPFQLQNLDVYTVQQNFPCPVKQKI